MKPYPKSEQLARAERRYRRKVASAKQWQRITAAKQGPCRVCSDPGPNDLHHLVLRSQGGDDTADNIVPLCRECHREVTLRDRRSLRMLAESLTDGEYAYVIGRCGEGALERLFGVMAR